MMPEREYDIIIVGARCAGATLATFLARRGASILILERDRLPSDQVISTHTIHPPGIDVLDEVGVGDEVRRVAPAGRISRLAKNNATVDIQYADGRAEYCPRRERLDGLLQHAASAAGAELIDCTRVTALIERDGRVVGVRAASNGRETEFRAPLVVGADGRRSTVARLTGAEEYLAYDAPRGMYWSYWDALDGWRSDFDMYIGNRNGDIRVIFRTDHNQLLIGSAPPVQTCYQWRTDPLGSLLADLSSDPVTAPLVQQPPVEKVRGTVMERYFFRRAAGPGWVLVGDAGHHKDFVIGDGITEALLQARTLASAIACGTEAALQRWWRARDVAALPMYYFAQDEVRPEPPLLLQEVVFKHVGQSRELQGRMAAVMEHQRSPYEIFPVSQILRWTLGAAAKGKMRVLPDFLTMGKRASAIKKEISDREALLQGCLPRRTESTVAVVVSSLETGL